VNNATMVEKTLVIHVPENQQTVSVRLEIETSCTCAQQRVQMAGSYIDAEPSARSLTT
jgi:hypothetical protein